MALWVVRTGKQGEREQRFLSTQRVFLTWDGFDRNLKDFPDRPTLTTAIRQASPDASPGRALTRAGWKRTVKSPIPDEAELVTEDVDLEDTAHDQIAQLIIRKFTGHALKHLVEALLRVQGYTTYRSPVGPDKGIDLLAAPGPFGFGHPRICVQVKSTEGPVDAPTLTQFIGAMQNVHADQGLLVSSGGFKSSKEIAAQFFRVRLWDQVDLVEQSLEHYDKLDADLRAEIPLKQVWVVSENAEVG